MLVDIVDYVREYRIDSGLAYETARNCLIDTLGCGLEALGYPACTKLLGPIMPGTTVPNGAKVPGTQFQLDPVQAAFNIGTIIRWLDFNDCWLAAEWGHGRRQGKLSNLHLGALDPATQQYVMLGKTFKGLTDEMLEWQTREFLLRESRHDQWTVYVRPEIVVEIAFSDVQQSPRYPAGMALRFARVKRYREDKRAGEADTIETVRRILEHGHAAGQ